MSQTTWSQFEAAYNDLEAQEVTLGNVDSWLREWSELEKRVSEQHMTLLRAKDEDTKNKAAEAVYTAFIQEVVPPSETINQKLKLKLLALDSEPTSETAEFIKKFRNEAELFRDTNTPLLADETTLSSDYNRIMGGISVELDGETLSIPEAEKRLLEPDQDLRERAWRAVQTAKLGVSGELDELFLQLLKLRRQLAVNAELPDFRSFAWRRLNRFDYTSEESLTLHASIASEVVPIIVKLREERQEDLGLTELRPWDMSVDPASREALHPFTAVTELEDGMARIFTRLDPELAEQFESLRDGWLDLEAREGKVPGLGYQGFLPVSKRPYIYWSVNGTHRDVWVLVHEAGHAFHSLASAAHNDLIWNFYPGMEFAEVASQTVELLMLPYLTKDEVGFYNEEDAARAKREGLERTLHQLPGLAQHDAFQHWLYAEAPEDVKIAQIDAKWLELSERFSPSADWSGLEREQAKGWQDYHVFAVPFYVLEYAFAWLGAVQIWRNALNDPQTALAKYREALALGGTRPLPELFETAGARFAFDRETVGELMRFVYSQR